MPGKSFVSRMSTLLDAFTFDSMRSQSFEAANTSGPRMSRWGLRNAGPNAALQSLPVLRSRSRDKVRNDGLAYLVADVLTTNIVGTGIKPQWGTSDAEFNKFLALLWADWTKESDAGMQFDFYGLQAMAFRSMLEGGDCFGRLRTRLAHDNMIVPLQVQLLEGEHCPHDWTRMLPNGAYIQNGVEFSPIGARVAYYLWRNHPGDALAKQFFQDFTPSRVPEEDVLHVANILRPGMVRGVPWLVRSLIKFHDLDEYDDAQLVRQKISAMFAGFVKKVAASPFPDRDGDLPAEDNGETSFPSLASGTLQGLEDGEDITFTDPPGVGQDYDPYMRNQKMDLAAENRILYEQLTGDYARGNDRTYRAAVNEFRRFVLREIGFFNFRFNAPTLARFIDLGMLAGEIKLPAGIDVRECNRVRWTPQAWDYINPVQDVQAKRDEVRAGFRSRGNVVSCDGEDVEVVDDEIERDNKRTDEKGIIVDSDPRYTNAKGASQQQTEEIQTDEGSAAAEPAPAKGK